MKGETFSSSALLWAVPTAALILIGLALLASVAVGVWRDPEPTLPAPTQSPARVQCVYEGTVIFSNDFDQARMEANGQVRVWIGEESVVMEGDCHIATQRGNLK